MEREREERRNANVENPVHPIRPATTLFWLREKVKLRSIEEKGCLNYGPTHEILSSTVINLEFNKKNRTHCNSHHRMTLGKPTQSKWDDAQKWLVNLSRGGQKNQSNTKPRNSNADDRRLIAAVPKKEGYSNDEDEEHGDEMECHGFASMIHHRVVNLSRGGEKNQSNTKPRNSNADDRRLIAAVPKKEGYSSGDDEGHGDEIERHGFASMIHHGVETKKVDCEESIWRVNKPLENSPLAMRSICVRDMGTEMTPIASQEH